MKSFPSLLAMLMAALALTSCLDSGGSGSSSDGSAPSSIISYKLVQTVSVSGADPGVTVVQPGATVEYNFIDATTIQGAGLNTYPTTSWSYSSSGNQATVQLNYAEGSSTETLTFNSETSGSYRSVSKLFSSGNSGWHEGTFTISSIGGGSGGGDSGACNESTGQVTVYTTKGDDGNISVSIDGSSVGTLSEHFTSGSPSCGASNSGAITRTLSAGSHSVSASSTNFSWGPTIFNITACGCLLFTLN